MHMTALHMLILAILALCRLAVGTRACNDHVHCIAPTLSLPLAGGAAILGIPGVLLLRLFSICIATARSTFDLQNKLDILLVTPTSLLVHCDSNWPGGVL